MANLNKVMLIGRLTRDPEVRTFSNGGKVAKFGFAVNNRTKKGGEWTDEPVYLDCQAFNRGDYERERHELLREIGDLKASLWELSAESGIPANLPSANVKPSRMTD